MSNGVLAQTSAPAPAYNSVVDENSIDLSTGQLSPVIVDLSIGPADNPLQSIRYAATVRNYFIAVSGSLSSQINVQIDRKSYTFNKVGSAWQPARNDGTSFNGSQFTDRDGIVYTFTTVSQTSPNFTSYPLLGYYPIMIGRSITHLDGRIVTLNYGTYSESSGVGTNRRTWTYYRLKSAVDNRGYMLKYKYYSDVAGNDWANLNTISAVNLGQNACGLTDNTCTSGSQKVTFAYPSSSVSTVTDALGRTTTYTVYSDRYGIKLNSP